MKPNFSSKIGNMDGQLSVFGSDLFLKSAANREMNTNHAER